MNPLITFAQSATYDLTPQSMRLPSFVWTAFTALNKVHGIWRWYRRAELYTNPNNFSQLIAGHALNIVLGDTLIVKVAAQCLLISTRVLECVQQQSALVNSSRCWWSAVKGDYSPKRQKSWKTLEPHPFLSPSTQLWFRSIGQSITDRIERIARCTLSLFVEAFTLSMKIMDAVDVLSLSPYTKNEGLNEGLINAIKWLDTLTENREALLEGLLENKEIIEKVLAGSTLNYEMLFNGVKNTLDKTESIHKQTHKITSLGNGLIVDIGKRIASGSMVALGLSDYRPAILAPKNIG